MYTEVSPDLLCKEAAGHVSCQVCTEAHSQPSAEDGSVKGCSLHSICNLAHCLYAGLSS